MMKAIQLQEEGADSEEAYDLRIRRNSEIVCIRQDNRKKAFKKNRKMMKVIDEDTQPEEQDEVKGTATSMVLCKEYREEIEALLRQKYEYEQLQELVQKLKSDEVIVKVEGAIGIRKLTSIDDDNLRKVIERIVIGGVAIELIQFMEQDDWMQLKLEAVWALANIASSTETYCKYLVSKNCVQIATQLLNSDEMAICEQSVWLLANLATDSTAYRDKILNEGAGPKLIRLIDKFKNKELNNITAWAMSNLCRAVPLPSYEAVAPIVETLCRMLAGGLIEEEEEFKDCLWAISYHCDAQKRQEKCVIETNLCVKLVEIIREDYNSELIIPCCRIIGNILMGNHTHVQKMLDLGVLEAYEKVIYHERRIVRREACWGLSNIAASTFDHVMQMLNNSSLINRLKQLFENDYEQVRVEVATTFTNMCQLKELNFDDLIIEMDFVPYFLDLLSSQSEKTVKQTLRALGYPLRASQQRTGPGEQNRFARELQKCGVSLKIQQLQYNPSDEIYYSSINLLQNYFDLCDPLQVHSSKPLMVQQSQPQEDGTEEGTKI